MAPDRAAIQTSEAHNGSAAERLALPRWPQVVLVGLFLLIALPFILTQNLLGRGAFDQVHFHEPAIRAFAEQLPSPDVSDYRSATTPGFHLFFAAIARYVTASPMAWQLINAGITALMLWLLAGACVRHMAREDGKAHGVLPLVVCLPALVSFYVLPPGIWLLPDNMGWLLVLLVLLSAISRRMSAGLLFWSGVALLALVFVRQSHLWAAAPLWAAAWLGVNEPRDRRLASAFDQWSARIPRTLLAVAATIPAFALVYYFYQLWGGLTPPSFQAQYGGGWNPATPAFILMQIGILALFFVGYWGPTLHRWSRERPMWLVLVAALGVLAAAIPETTFKYEERASGLWNVFNHLPTIAKHSSPALLVLSPIGALAVVAWAGALPPRTKWLFITILLAFVAAQAAGPLAWQRYHEPMLLILFPLMAMNVERKDVVDALTDRDYAAARFFGPLTLAFLFGLVTAYKLIRSDIPPDTIPTPDGRRVPAPAKAPEEPPPMVPAAGFWRFSEGSAA